MEKNSPMPVPGYILGDPFSYNSWDQIMNLGMVPGTMKTPPEVKCW